MNRKDDNTGRWRVGYQTCYYRDCDSETGGGPLPWREWRQEPRSDFAGLIMGNSELPNNDDPIYRLNLKTFLGNSQIFLRDKICLS